MCFDFISVKKTGLCFVNFFCTIRYMSDSESSKKFFGYMIGSVTIFIWGITFVSTKTLLSDFSALEILFGRFVIAYVGLWALKPRVLRTKNLREEAVFMMAGLCGVTLYQFLENVAIMYTSASNVSVIVSLTPIFTAVVSQIFLREKCITPFFVLGFCIAIFGVALVSFNGRINFHFNPRGDFLALGAAASWGFYSLAVSKINKLGLDVVVATRRAFFWAIIFMMPLVLGGAFLPALKNTSSFVVNMDAAANAARFTKIINWANLLFLGLMASTFCFSAWSRACKIVGTVRISVGLYLIPVVTTIFAFFVLHEKITAMGIVGTLCTISGLAISNFAQINSQGRGA